MTLEKLKKLLADGVITQDEYTESIEKFGLKEDPEDDPLKNLDEKTKAAIQKMLQSERDRAANKVGNDKKGEIEGLKKQLEDLKKTKLTEDERKKFEQEQQQKEFEQQKRDFAEMQNKYTASQALQKAGLESGDDVVNLVLGTDTDATKKNVEALAALVDRLVKAEVEKRFKESGRDPDKGGNPAGGEANPWKEGSINFTEQMKIEINDPEKAKRLKAAAGVN